MPGVIFDDRWYNLDLVERLWRFFKKKALWNGHCPTLADVRTAIRGLFGKPGQSKAEFAFLLT